MKSSVSKEHKRLHFLVELMVEINLDMMMLRLAPERMETVAMLLNLSFFLPSASIEAAATRTSTPLDATLISL